MHMYILAQILVCFIEFMVCNVYITHTPVLNLGSVMCAHPRLNTPRCVMYIAHHICVTFKKIVRYHSIEVASLNFHVQLEIIVILDIKLF